MTGMTPDEVASAYNARAQSYIASVGQVESWPDVDRELLVAWAKGVEGPVLDVGSGPGHWTDLFRAEGVDVCGVDPASAFVEDAQQRFPLTKFRVGHAEDLDVADASIGGVLAWFSLIHIPPTELVSPLKEFQRALKPGGSLLLGFFLGESGQAFVHPIAPAYFWSIDALTELLDLAGFSVLSSRVHGEPAPGAQALIIAGRRASQGSARVSPHFP